MSASDKIEAGMDKAKGKAKEAVGNLTDNEQMVAEGKADQVKGGAKKVVGDVKDTAKDIMND
ncbi:CsbD family protein [Leucobacter sp. UCMA 4100]|uniref:CsbD family protein n=1 Tax=Leucobacter sp. UCMA 4100 TaxID=2810534 RepID=UPI0022EAA38E|nr:CsbD family protein [Leucobacter sp. UCMA 4100]MDA3146259.1 CsbD family protein [Leucobacter sp. UCMA 4100]